MRKIILSIFFALSCIETHAVLPPLVNLGEMVQDFVLETKRIVIPGIPDAFNASIVQIQGKTLMSFRFRDINGTTNSVGFVWLDKEFNVIGEPKVLDVSEPERTFTSKIQDPRLILQGKNLYMVFSNVFPEGSGEVRRLMIAKIYENGNTFRIANPEPFTALEGVQLGPIEKNWVPFIYRNQLLLAYSIVPHLICKPYFGTGTCTWVAQTKGNIEWNWGKIRGGTQALKVDGQYLSFFHTWKDMFTTVSNKKKISHYFIGAYTFMAHPPFAVTQVSKTPIISKDFYEPPYYVTWKPLRCVFPCGFIFDENFIWISYGRQDHEVWVVKLDKQGLLDSLIPVTTE